MMVIDLWSALGGFIATFIIEFLIILVLFRKDFWKIAGYIFLINLFTWPLANFVFDIYSNFIVVELGVVIVESMLIMRLFEKSYMNSLGISLLANFASALAGLIFAMVGF